MDALRDYLAQLRRIWNEMNSRQRFALLGLVFLCVGLAGGLVLEPLRQRNELVGRVPGLIE